MKIFAYFAAINVAILASLTKAQTSEKLVSELVQSGPKWTQENPKLLHVEPLGSMVKLRCPAKGIPHPQITWKKNGVPIEQVPRPLNQKAYVQKSEKWELKIHGLMKSDEGDYTCSVSNSHGVIERTHTVEVLQYLMDKPILVEQSDNLTLIEGMDAHFYCKFKSDLAMVVHWLRPAEGIRSVPGATIDGSNHSHFEIIQNQDGHSLTGQSLTIYEVEPSDAGLYFCVGKTNSGLTPGFLHLNVLRRDEAILQKPKNVSVELGGTAYFTCQSHGKLLKKSTSWVKLEENDDFVVVGEGSSILEIENATYAHEGVYACVVGDEVANVQAVAFLSIKEPEVVPFPTEDQNTYIMIGIVAMTLILIPLLVFIFVLCRKWRHEKAQKKHAIDRAQALSAWTKKVIIDRQSNSANSSGEFSAPTVRIEKMRKPILSQASSRYKMSSHDTMTTITEYELPLDIDWEFPREQLFLDKVIGEGAFGKVMKGTAAQILKYEDRSTVAVKMLKEGHTDQDVIDLVSEMDLMKMIGRHTNIINLLGVCTQDGPLYVIVEFAEHGNLRDFLRKHSDRYDGYEMPNSSRPIISEKQLISFARQICKGMEYLASRKCIHRDLAARNVLVAKDYVVKIADFGLARDVQKNEYYRKISDGFLPIRWMAPESLFERRYTLQSDVWSFGIVLWEIMSLGSNPYTDLSTVELHFAFLRERRRLEKPLNCSEDIYMIMRKCWNDDPLHRPTFSELVEYFDALLTNAKEGIYLDVGDGMSLASKSTGETLIAGSEMSTMSSVWSSPQWTFDSLGNPTPAPPSILPTSMYAKQNSSGSSGLGSTSDEINYSPVVPSGGSYFSNNIYGIQEEKEFSTFRSPLYANQYFKVQKPKEEIDEENFEDEGIATMTPPKTPADEYSKSFGDQMQTSVL